MLSSKAKSGLSEASDGKNTSATSKLSKVTRNGSTKSDTGSPSPVQKPSSPVPKLSSMVQKPSSPVPKLSSTVQKPSSPAPKLSSPAPKPSSPVPKPSSPVPKSRSLVERSPKSAESKPPIKTSTTPEKLQHASKSSELQAKLDAVQEDLKKAREQLAFVEQEKIRIVEELNEAKRLVTETNEKLQEAIVTKEKAEKSLEIHKFQVDELEQVGIEGSQKSKEAHQKELENIQNQHALDISMLHSVTEELHKLKTELANATDAKNNALNEADEAKKTAQLNEEKVEVLSREVIHLKSLLDSELDNMNKEAAQMITKLNVEINALELELERGKSAEEKLHKMEALVEQLQMELSVAREAKSHASKQIGDLKDSVVSLEARLNEANESEKSATESLEITSKKIEEYATLLQDAETEIASLEGKMKSIEIEADNYKNNLKESDMRLDLSQQEVLSLGQAVELLKSQIKKLEEEKLQALNKVKFAASDIDELSEEKNKLIDELKTSKDELQKVKEAMEGLASALNEMSTESRENQERLLEKQAEIEDARLQIEQLDSTLKNTEERYEVMLDEARYEIVCLKKTVEKLEAETSNSSTEWDTKELRLINAIKKSEDELASLKVEMAKVVDSLKLAEQEAHEAKADGAEMLNKLKQAEYAAAAAYEAAEEAKSETLRLKERLLDKENELQNITQENDDLRTRETAALHKIKELSSLLEEATAKRTDDKNELSKTEKEYDPLSNISHNMNSHERVVHYHADNQKTNEENKKGVHHDEEEDPTGIVSKDLASEKEDEDEYGDDDAYSKIHGAIFEQTNSMTESTEISPTMNQQQKKKKPLLHKFGSLLKKGSHKSPK